MQQAEKLLRAHPERITILAPLTTWFLTVLCGTGHVVYTMFPIIEDIAVKKGKAISGVKTQNLDEGDKVASIAVIPGVEIEEEVE